MSTLRLDGLSVPRAGRPVVKNVSLEIPPGQVTALLGANGAGKSTLVKILTGVITPDSGTVARDEWTMVGHLPQEAEAHGEETILDVATGRMDELQSHPTVKPVALVADAMRDCSRRGDIVLDLFGGSGTTLLAAERVGRRAFMLEIEPRFVDVAIKRWQTFSKKDAICAESGLSFDDIASTRVIPSAAGATAPDVRSARSSW